MNSIVASALVGAMVVVGKWSRDESLSIDNVLGVAGMAVGLTLLSSMNRDFGRAFALLAVVSVALFQLGPILNRVKLGSD